MTDWTKRAEVVATWRASGATARVFAAEHGIGSSTLQWWARELRERAAVATPKAATPVRRQPASVHLARVMQPGERMDCPTGLALDVDGVRIAVHSDFDEALLARVVRVLREARA